MTEADILMPPKLVPVFEGEARIRGAWGGRGSAKTRTFAKMTAVRGYMWSQTGMSGQILCAREHLNSLDESSMEEVKAAIRSEPWLNDFYEIGQRYIRTRCGRIEYTFAGLRHNVDSIKSKARILLCWVDEAEGVSERAWMKLMPTVREEGSEVWVTWNPENKRSATHKRFRENPPDDAKIVQMNYRDNPWFPAVLEAERREDYAKRPETYGHVWDGEFLEHAEGAYYLREMREVKESGRIREVKYRPELPVFTAWDLGIGDSTAIWCAQFVGQEVHLIDYFEDAGVGLDHYVRWLKSKDYIYDAHVLPHDVEVRELGSGMSRYETLQTLGLHNIVIAPKLRVDDGIQQVRSFLTRCWFDADNCEEGIEALRAYHREYNDARMTYNERPHHDWASHGADAFRYLAVGAPGTQRTGWDKPVRRRIRGRVA